MVEVKPENYFYVCNDEVLKDLQDLLSFLRKSDDEVFYYHFNEEKNDYASWVREILKEKALANRMDRAKVREDLIDLVEARLKRKPAQTKTKKSIIEQIKNAIVHG